LLPFPQILSKISERDIINLFEDNDLKSIGQLLMKYKKRPEIRVSDIMNLIEDKEQRDMVASLAIGEDIWNHEACLGIINRFESIRKKNKNTLIDKIKAAEKNNDVELIDKLLNQKQKLAILTEKIKRHC
jgi:DNA polymerase II small subunit/DNA polymerase delta subunit B